MCRERINKKMQNKNQTEVKEDRYCGGLVVARNWKRFLLVDSDYFIPLLKKDKWSEKSTALEALSQTLELAKDKFILDKEFRFVQNVDNKSLIVFLVTLDSEQTEKQVEINPKMRWIEWNPPHLIDKKILDPLLKSLENRFDPSSKSTQVEEPTSTKTAKNPIDTKKFVVHCRKSKYDVYIGRPNPSIPSKDCKWGNPFKIGRDGDRDDVIRKYEEWILKKPELIAQAKKELKGKVLACWCAPLGCHGDVLARIANE